MDAESWKVFAVTDMISSERDGTAGAVKIGDGFLFGWYYFGPTPTPTNLPSRIAIPVFGSN